MIGNLLGFLVLVAIAVLFGWLVFRAWRAKNAIVKWGGVALSGLLTLLLALASVVALIGLVKLYGPRGNPVRDLTIAGTPEQIARGEHIAGAVCAGCHTTNEELPLSGGKNLSDEAGLPLGNLTPANLTPAGALKDWSDGEILRAIREGADPRGRLLVVMTTQHFREFSEVDIQAVIAYLRSQPAIPNDVPEENPSLLAVFFIGAGLIPLPPAPTTDPVAAPPPGPTVEYGRYTAGYVGCSDCHGADLTGSAGGLGPAGPSLRVVKSWTLEQFITTLRTGVDPNGHALDSKQMRWKFIGRLDDEELAAVYAYLNSLP